MNNSKLKVVILNLLVVGSLLSACGPTFHKDIAPIVYTKCTGCHRPGEIGPFPFTSYEEVKKHTEMIAEVTQTRYMPPFLADPEYAVYANANVLTNEEINLISSWIENGTPEGAQSDISLPLQRPIGSRLGKPDTTLCMSQAYTIQPKTLDEYREFVLPLDLPEDKFVKGIEFRPGNTKVVHHGWVYWDEMRQGREMELEDEDFGVDAFERMGRFSLPKIAGYLPGYSPAYYPENYAKTLKAHSDLLIQIHYGPTPVLRTDSSCVNLFFSEIQGTKEVHLQEITEGHLSTISQTEIQQLVLGDFSPLEKHLHIPAGEVRTFMERFFVEKDIQILSVIPHMHFRGTFFQSYAISPAGDTLPLVKIPHWDFNWQNMYIFEEPVSIPAGSVIWVEGTFDNREDNPFNPVIPPEDTGFGFGTENEMLEMTFEYILE